MQSNAEGTRRNPSIVGPATSAPRDILGVFAVGARLSGLRLFEGIEKLAGHAESIAIKFGLKDAALIQSVRNGDIEQTKGLLAAGVNPLAPSARRDGWSPLHEVAHNGDLAMLEVFLEHVRENPEHASIFNTAELVGHRIPYQVALDNGHVQFAQRMLEAGHAHVLSIDRNGRSGLSRLAFAGLSDHLRQCAALYDKETFAEHADSAALALQHEAVLGATADRLGVIQMLREHGVDLFARNGPDGGTLLHSAASAGDGAVLPWLLKQPGADINASDRNGMTALHIAAAHGRHALVQTLLDHGANPNATSIHDPARNLAEATPLMLAASRGHQHTVDVLANDPQTRLGITSKSSGLHAVDYARRNGHEQVASSIENNLRRRFSATAGLKNHVHISNVLRPTPHNQSSPRPGRRP